MLKAVDRFETGAEGAQVHIRHAGDRGLLVGGKCADHGAKRSYLSLFFFVFVPKGTNTRCCDGSQTMCFAMM